MNETFVVDPIFRGSRLFYSWMAHQALQQDGVRPRILTREEYRSDDFPTYFADDADIERVIALPPGFWYGKLPDGQIQELVGAIASRVGTTASGAPAHVHFSGLDEMFPTLLDALVEQFAGKDRAPSFSFVHYDARYLLSDGAGFLKIRATIRAALERLPGARMLVLDDRVERALPAEFEDRVVVLPDPAPLTPQGLAAIHDLPRASTLYDTGDARIRVTAIGKQSDRKGLPDILQAAAELGPGARSRIYLSGPLEADQERLRDPLMQLVPDPVVWRDDYVPEEEIRLTYRDGDYVLLPYDRSFEGSSGVFAYALAFRKPIIATDHGCVGYRVKRHNLGFVYPAGRHGALAKLLREVPAPGSEPYRAMQEHMACYESERTMAHFSARLRDVVGAARRSAGAWAGADTAPDVGARTDGSAVPAPSRPATASTPKLQETLERRAFAPPSLDYRQIMLFDTSVSSRNLGDQIIMDAVRPLLRIIFPKCLFVNAPTHEYTGTEVLKLIEESAYAFVCGTNLLASHADDYKQWKLQGTDAFLLSGLTLLGVGWWQYQDRPNAYSQLLYRRILSDRTIHSVRDSYTKNQLAAAGISNVLNTSCPTTWWLTPRHLARVPKEPRETVVFTLTDYARNAAADSAIVARLAKRYREVHCWLQGARDHEYARSLGVGSLKYIAPTLEAYTEFLASTDCDYVGTRLHAGIRALHAGRRALILAVDNRATEIARDIGLPVIPRDDVAALARTLDAGWDLEIHVPYPEINTWVRQFGHSYDFNLEHLIDELVYGLPADPSATGQPGRRALITISGCIKRDAYMHYQVHFRDQATGGQFTLLVFRHERTIGFTIHRGSNDTSAAGPFEGIDFQSDGSSASAFKIFLRPDRKDIMTSADLSRNGGRLFDTLENYLCLVTDNPGTRVIVYPDIENKMDARTLLTGAAQEFLRRLRLQRR